jgi:hypothetical protein
MALLALDGRRVMIGSSKQEWKTLYRAFRIAQQGPGDEDGWVHPDVAASIAAQDAIEIGARAGFCLRHAPKLPKVGFGALLAKQDWERPAPGSAPTLPRYVRGMILRRPRIQAGGYRPHWEPHAMRWHCRTEDLPEEA